jgi:hypothetical protein
VFHEAGMPRRKRSLMASPNGNLISGIVFRVDFLNGVSKKRQGRCSVTWLVGSDYQQTTPFLVSINDRLT